MAVESGIAISVLLNEPKEYIDAMFLYLELRANPVLKQKLRTNADILSELDSLL